MSSWAGWNTFAGRICAAGRSLESLKGVRNGGWGYTLLSLIFYKNFIACAMEINCFRILIAC